MRCKLFSRLSAVCGSLLAATLAFAPLPAQGAVILVFGQNATVNTVSGTVAGNVTTINADDIAVTITSYAGGGTPIQAFLSFTNVMSDSFATVLAGVIDQSYTGSFCITSAINCGGINYLSGTFDDDFQGDLGGSSFTLGASTPPPGAVTFTSSILTPAQLQIERALAFSFSNVMPPLALCGPAGSQTVCAFTASIAGNFSASTVVQVAEPGTLALLGLAIAGLGLMRRRQVF